ncbi:aldo/keto reductase [Streptomyces litchfieldiae]|uniref:Aldo/keto reductase n=1 Tax=Streptomyces litchfieldiae TaxID=3075543 RepID=A0ABU2MIS8_9ACTN|nr:aldo/keto reductase [Streptomyces sp. DSM 44938]MDT0341479.1 aldo/keto reductase [Streptomyces sp. DSM 44938]
MRIGDFEVGRIGFGAMRLASDGTIWEAPADRESAVALLRRAVELGVKLVDTADAYALGANEELIAEALHPCADDVVIATKGGVARPGPAEWVPLGRPEYLRQQAELSLRRLRREVIDLYYLHRVDPQVPLADQVGALAELRKEGKIRHIGLSEVTVGQVEEARGIAPIAAVQNLYNLTDRTHEAVVDHADRNGIAFVPFFPIAIGDHAKADSPVAAVAAEVGATPAQTALAWLLHRSPHVFPIPGTTSRAHLEENVAAAGLTLTEEQFTRLDRAGR